MSAGSSAELSAGDAETDARAAHARVYEDEKEIMLSKFDAFRSTRQHGAAMSTARQAGGGAAGLRFALIQLHIRGRDRARGRRIGW